MTIAKRSFGKLGIVLCGALLGYTSYGQPSASVAVFLPVPSVEVVLPSVEIHTESDFYEPLTPYGRWEVVGSYGRVWIPNQVEADWRPYSDGSWQRTDDGWYWASDEPWAWATYHYGRWDFTEQYGWYWVPQTQWAPAWVSWHTGGGYIGWSPLNTPDVRIISPRAYVFVEDRHFMEPVRRSSVVVNNTTIINQTVIREAPATAVIERASGRKIQAIPVQELLQKTEAAVVAKQRTPAATSEKTIQPSVRNEAQPVERKAIAAHESPQVEKPAVVTHEIVAPTQKTHETQSEKPKPVPAAPQLPPVPVIRESKPEAKPEANHPSAIKEPAQPKADMRAAQQEKPANSSEKKAQKSAKENPGAGEQNGTEPADKDHEKKHGE